MIEGRDHENMSVYAIVLNWNGGERLFRCIGSLLDIRSPKLNIVVADNGSVDGTIDRINSRSNSRLHLIKNGSNIGFGAGNNPAIDYALHSGAEYVWLVNYDCVVTENSLRNLLSRINDCKAIGIVGSSILDMENHKVVLALGGGWVDKIFGLGGHTVRDGLFSRIDYVTGASMLLSRNCLECIGKFDEQFFMYWEDVDLCERARAQGFKIAVALDSIVYHEESSSLSDSALRKESLMAASSSLYFRKHAPVPALPIILRSLRISVKHIFHGRFAHCLAYLKAAVNPGSVVEK